MTKDEALTQALEALEQSQTKAPCGKSGVVYWEGVKIHEAAIAAIKEALAQPEQEPTWWLVEYHDWAREFVTEKPEESIAIKKATPLYTTPQQRTWVGLTDEEVEKLDCVQALWQDEGECEIHGVKEFYRNIEAKLKEKNT